jgi:adenylyl-sulfate kinase
MIIWITGLSGAGKSTIAEGLAERIRTDCCIPLIIDGDALREELCRDLGFSDKDRAENIRRAGAVALIAARSGITSICAMISPLRQERDSVRRMAVSRGIRFLEVYVSTSLKTCEARDVKGLYKKARAGLIPRFTGIDSPYEPPMNPELTISTEQLTIAEAVEMVYHTVIGQWSTEIWRGK